MSQALSDRQRRAIHDLALKARTLLMTEAREHLEGVYGLYEDGHIEPPDRLPQVQKDSEKQETYRRLVQSLDDEARTGFSRPEAVEKLVKEVAFTHLNRLVAFKMMEARDLIRGTLDKGTDSNAFKFYLADPEHADDLALYERGDVDVAYRHFLLWQSGQIAQGIRVLFDPDTLASRLFPRPRALNDLLDLLNDAGLEEVWLADETVGWVYQYFNEPELQAAFEKVSSGSGKFEAKDIPSATQLFTPHWVVRFLVQNTLGRLWVQMHPDTKLKDTELLNYLVPLEGALPEEPLRPVREITLLDPACGGMHFGLVAFDLFAAMYEEELEHGGEAGWPEMPSVGDARDIPTAILEHNLFGIDLDLRAVQLSALTLYLKAKSHNPEATITASNLACADVTPLNGQRLGTFVRQARFKRPVYERLMRGLWEKLQDAQQLGSLLCLEKEMKSLIEEERARYRETPLFAGLDGAFEAEAAEEEFWDIISQQIIQGLNKFAREQAAEGVDQSFFTGEANKGLRLLDLMLQHYDVVVTNPPYMSGGKMNRHLKDLVGAAYPEGSSDLYAAFIQRCLELADQRGYVGMLTMHSFMFLSSHQELRDAVRDDAAVCAMAHCGPALFGVGNPDTLQTTAFALRKAPDDEIRMNNKGTYFRLVHKPSSDEKRLALEKALVDGTNAYCVAQRDFGLIPGQPWVYWISPKLFYAFEHYQPLLEVDRTDGHKTAKNFRFIRLHWELLASSIGLGRRWRWSARAFDQVRYGRLYGQTVDWGAAAHWFYSHNSSSSCLKSDLQNRSGVSWSRVASRGVNARRFSAGYIPDVATPSVYPSTDEEQLVLVAVLNSNLGQYVLDMLNPTINYALGDIQSFPLKPVTGKETEELKELVNEIEGTFRALYSQNEIMPLFTAPPRWSNGLSDRSDTATSLAEIEKQVDSLVYEWYGIADKERADIEAELAGEPPPEDEEGIAYFLESEGEADVDLSMNRQELATCWISYAVGSILGRFRPGMLDALGGAVYRHDDLAAASVAAPDEPAADGIRRPAERFAYVGEEGANHVFSADVEAALRDLVLENGIAVLDRSHPHDLPALVNQALALMLGHDEAREVISEGARGDLRQFLSKKFFTDCHFKMYSQSRRKAPVYWPLQSANLRYGFVLFHEKIDETTLYVLQRDYLDVKLNGLRQRIGDLTAREEGLEGTARKRVARQIQELSRTLEEIETFAKTIDRIVREGYEPEPNWIDDGVILRMAPLWELIPIWRSEPKKYWKRLQEGEYDWSHIAMNYWPDRVREACKENKSYAIGHGHPEWFEGT